MPEASFITAFARLNEDETLNEMTRAFPKNLKETMSNTYYRKDDVNGLYWRIKLLRNRAAHSIGRAYTTHSGRSARWLSISSKIMLIQYGGDTMRLNTTLIDLEKSEYIKTLIQKEIDANNSKINVQRLIFPQESPKGYGKDNPMVIYPEKYPFFDLNEGFISLSVEILKYICKQLSVFKAALTLSHAMMNT